MEYPTWYMQVYGVSQFPKSERDYWDRVREYVIEHDGLRCQACRKKGKRREFTVHHIIPRIKGGSDELENLITLHYDCHDYVETMEYQTRSEVINSTIGKSKFELTQAKYQNNTDIPVGVIVPIDEIPHEGADAKIVCPCGIIHRRIQSSIGVTINSVACICGKSAIYQDGEWIWKDRYIKPPAETKHEKAVEALKPRKPREKQPQPEIIEFREGEKYSHSIVVCPVCKTAIMFWKPKFRFSGAKCSCGCQAEYRNGVFMWHGLMPSYQEDIYHEE